MRMTASWFRSLDLPHTRLWRDSTAPESGLPSDCHPDCIIVLEAVNEVLARSNQEPDDGKNASPSQRDHRANTRNRHQAPAHIIVADDGQHAAMQ